MNDRIKFYGLGDLATSNQISKSKEFLTNIKIDIIKDDINLVIECFNILKYIKAGVLFEEFPDAETQLNKILGISLKDFKNMNLTDIYSIIDSWLISDFWELFSKYKLYDNYSNSDFLEFLSDKNPNIKLILQNKNIVNSFDEEFKKYLISNYEHIPVLLDHLEIESRGNTKTIYIPKSLDYNEINELLEQYIDSDRPSINLLDLIVTIRDRDEIRVSDKIRLKAKKRKEQETDIFFQENTGHMVGISIKFDPDFDELQNYNLEKGMTNLVYDYNWIKNNLDYSTLLNNFIYLFEFVDNQMRISLTSLKNDVQSIESLFSTKSKNNYLTSWSFNFKEQISSIQIYAYIDILKNLGINLETLLQWFFSTYIFENFEIKNFNINIPSEGITYFEKCRILIPEIESILKKYNMIVDEGEIDHELLSISSKPLSISDCKSLFPKKNIYQSFENYDLICYYFFSDQCMLNYIKDDENKYSSFYELLLRKTVTVDDYHECYYKDIKWLQENNFLLISEQNEIFIKDQLLIKILYNLYKYESLHYINLAPIEKQKIDKLIENGELISTSTLFSKAEAQYFNYYLNKKNFGNSLDLRNMYVHGTQPHDEGNSSIHKRNYIIILKILVLIIIKINDELYEK